MEDEIKQNDHSKSKTGILNNFSDNYDDDDDEEDLIVPGFLKKPIKVFNQVLTPRKAIKPDEDKCLSPFDSPSLNVKSVSARGKGKAKFSLFNLLTEKKHDDDIQEKVQDIIQMQAADFTPLPDDDDDDDDGDEELNKEKEVMDFSQGFSQDFFQHDIKIENEAEVSTDDGIKPVTFNNKITNDFSDTFPGREFFTRPSYIMDMRNVLKDLFKYTMDSDDVMAANEEISEATDEEINSLIFQVVETNTGVSLSFNSDYSKIVWKLVYCSEDYTISQISTQFLMTSLLNNKAVENSADVENLWKPNLDDFIEALKRLGVNPAIILSNNEINNVVNSELLRHDSIEEEEFVNTRSIRKVLHKRLFNVEAIIKFFTSYIEKFPLNFTIGQLKGFVLLTINLIVEKLVQFILWELKVLLGVILDSYSPTQWKEEIKDICCVIISLDWHHRDMLQVVEAIPPTDRGLAFQQILAFNLASKFLCNNIITIDNVVSAPLTPDTIFNILLHIHMDEDTDYWLMFTIFNLIGICSHTENTHSASKVHTMNNIVNKLTVLNGEIKECMGRHLDRTKVKNLLIRLISRYKFASTKLHTQSHLDSYFEKHETPVQVEQIGEMTPSPDTD